MVTTRGRTWFIGSVGAVGLVALVAFVVRAPALPQSTRSGASVTRDESRVVTSFSAVDRQSVTMTPTTSPPKHLSSTSVLQPSTAKRLAAHGHTSTAGLPDYLVAQGFTRDADAGKRVALTFDDGPSLNTTEILGILSRYRAHATFFFIGGRSQPPGRWQPAVLRAVLRQGSEIGNHTMQHKQLYKMTFAQDEWQIEQAENVFYREVGVRPLYVRPAGGYLDQTGLDAIKALHKMYVYWDCAGFDTVKDFTSTDIYDSVMENVRSGSVILLHETNPRTVAALPRILASLEKRGYQVDDITGLLKH